MIAGEAYSCLTLPALWGYGIHVEKQADMGLRRLPKKSAQTLPEDAYTPVYMAFCNFVGGVTSPLLANIALSVIEDKYERWVEHRKKITPTRKCDGITAARRSRSVDRKRGVPVFFPIRYADDFVILVSGSREDAEAEKLALSDYLQHVTGLELSDEKTRISSAVHGFEFLGTRVRLK